MLRAHAGRENTKTKKSEIHLFVTHFRRAHSPEQVLRAVFEFLAEGGLAPLSYDDDRKQAMLK
jgi:hypothetical protein